MKTKSVLSKIFSVLRFIIVTLWRLALLAAALVALVGGGLYMTVQTLLCGPSETVRNELTLTLLESDVTRHIPGYFLDQKTLNDICAIPSTLSDTVSDPSLITVAPAADQTGTTLDVGRYAAKVTFLTEPSQLSVPLVGGSNHVGFTEDGILMMTTDAAAAKTLGLEGRCGQILILNGQANEGLFAAQSGYAPRAAIGQLADGTVILVTTDGWTLNHYGSTYRDLINIMTHYGAVNACIISNATEETP